MSDIKKVSVRIRGKEYFINCREDEEYIQKVAYYLDKKMTQISNSNPTLDSSKIYVLAALNMADELFKAVDVIDKLKQKPNAKIDLSLIEEIERIKKTELPVEDVKNP
jgi:cell division protein ZapA